MLPEDFSHPYVLLGSAAVFSNLLFAKTHGYKSKKGNFSA